MFGNSSFILGKLWKIVEIILVIVEISTSASVTDTEMFSILRPAGAPHGGLDYRTAEWLIDNLHSISFNSGSSSATLAQCVAARYHL